MLELDSLVDGVAAVTYGTPESAAAMRCASETASGVLLGGGLGGGVGAGVSFWLVGEQEQNMGDPGVAADVWQSAGLDAAALVEDIQTQPVKDALLHNTQQAADRGAFGVPTFFVGDEMFFGKERIIQIEEMIQQ